MLSSLGRLLERVMEAPKGRDKFTQRTPGPLYSQLLFTDFAA